MIVRTFTAHAAPAIDATLASGDKFQQQPAFAMTVVVGDGDGETVTVLHGADGLLEAGALADGLERLAVRLRYRLQNGLNKPLDGRAQSSFN